MELRELFFRFNFIYNFIPLKLLLKLAKKKMIYPFYHYVGDKKNCLTSNLYKVKNIEEFKKDIVFFKKHFTPYSINEIHKINSYGFMLSFDDGLSNFYHKVVPVLKNENITAINFLNTDFIDNKNLFFRYKINFLIEKIKLNEIDFQQKLNISKLFKIKKYRKNSIIKKLKKINHSNSFLINKLSEISAINFKEYLNTHTPYLTKNQINELIDVGFYFGAHSASHPHYYTLSLDDQINETLSSINFLKNNFHIKKISFSFPFSDYGVSEDFFVKINQDITTFGTASIKDELSPIKNIQRIPMEHKNGIYSAKTIIKGELILYLLKKMIGKHKIIRS